MKEVMTASGGRAFVVVTLLPGVRAVIGDKDAWVERRLIQVAVKTPSRPWKIRIAMRHDNVHTLATWTPVSEAACYAAELRIDLSHRCVVPLVADGPGGLG